MRQGTRCGVQPLNVTLINMSDFISADDREQQTVLSYASPLLVSLSISETIAFSNSNILCAPLLFLFRNGEAVEFHNHQSSALVFFISAYCDNF